MWRPAGRFPTRGPARFWPTCRSIGPWKAAISFARPTSMNSRKTRHSFAGLAWSLTARQSWVKPAKKCRWASVPRSFPAVVHSTTRPVRRRAALTDITSGACRSTSTPASAATRAWSPAKRKTTSPSLARTRSFAAARCTGFASIVTIPMATPTPVRSVERATARSRGSAGFAPARGLHAM